MQDNLIQISTGIGKSHGFYLNNKNDDRITFMLLDVGTNRIELSLYINQLTNFDH